MMAALVDCRPCYCIVSGRGSFQHSSVFYKEFRAVFRALQLDPGSFELLLLRVAPLLQTWNFTLLKNENTF